MAAPVTEYGARSREVYFPAGTVWYDFYTGKEYKGGQTVSIDAPYARMPLFVAAGSISPSAPTCSGAPRSPPTSSTSMSIPAATASSPL